MSFKAGDPVLVTIRARWEAQDKDWLQVSISSQETKIAIPIKDVEELEKALPDEAEWLPRDAVVDDGGVYWTRTHDGHWQAFTGQVYEHEYPKRPLTPLARAGKPWG